MIVETMTPRPTLLGIDSDTPVDVFCLSDRDFHWIVQPDDFHSLVEHVNRHGGPAFWEIVPRRTS